MIILTPVQAKNVLDNLDPVAQAYGITPRTVFERMVDAEAAGARLETLVMYLAAGNDDTIALSALFHPEMPGMMTKLTRAGVDSIQHSSANLVYYRIERRRFIRQLGVALWVNDESAACLLARPQTLLYRDYMISPQWAAKRKAAVARAGNTCQRCGRRNCRIEIHHLTYVRLGQERPEDLVAVCTDCHRHLDHQMGTGRGRKAVTRGTH